MGLMANRRGLNRIEKKGTSLNGFSAEALVVPLHIVKIMSQYSWVDCIFAMGSVKLVSLEFNFNRAK
jgi:hypothetical protein